MSLSERKRRRLVKDTPAGEAGEQNAYVAMSSAVAQTGTAVTALADACAALRATREPAGRQDDSKAEHDRALLETIVAAATSAASALRAVVSMARQQRDGLLLDGDVAAAVAAVDTAMLQQAISCVVA